MTAASNGTPVSLSIATPVASNVPSPIGTGVSVVAIEAMTSAQKAPAGWAPTPIDSRHTDNVPASRRKISPLNRVTCAIRRGRRTRPAGAALMKSSTRRIGPIPSSHAGRTELPRRRSHRASEGMAMATARKTVTTPASQREASRWSHSTTSMARAKAA